MISASDRLHLLLHLLHLLAPGLLQEVDEEPLEVITDSSPCSATCGLGVRTQTLCRLRDSEAAVEERKGSDGGAEVSEACRVRTVRCLESWQCGLRTRTVAAGQTLELDCLGEVMEAMGRFSWRVSWRYARGVVSSDDSLFAGLEAPRLDRLVLDPVREDDAGTYRCDVQDAAFRRVKRVYWGVRVLPAGVLDLDYDRSLSRWNQAPRRQTQTAPRLNFLYMMLVSLASSLLLTGLVLLALEVRRRRRRKVCCRNASAPP
ncbi:transmembrane protein 81 [Salarias fasciatus]|uniref:transmembrane protein 81 n=1 Tax=Salarias fasciatus TaxID=181472 RepID=UPI001176A9F2|nr:transmembrane protein 81 [Salarias fasciatus]